MIWKITETVWVQTPCPLNKMPCLESLEKHTYWPMTKFFLLSSRFRRLSKEGAWIVFGQIAAVLGSLVGVRVLTELLDPAAYGELALGVTIATLVNATIMGPLCNGATRFYATAVENNSLPDYLKSVANLVLKATGVVLVIVGIVALELFAAGNQHWAMIVVSAMLFSILSGYNSILNGIQNAARQRTIVALHSGLEAWGKFLLAAGLIVIFGAFSSLAIAGYALAILIVLAFQSFFFINKIAADIKQQDVKSLHEYLIRKKIFEYAWPFATWGIMLWAYMSAGKWSLQFFCSSEEVGYYAVLFQLGYYPITTMATMVNQFLEPIYYQRAGDGTNPERVLNVFRIARRVFLFSLVIVIFLFFMLFYFHALIFHYFVSADFSKVSHLLPFMCLYAGIFVSSQFCSLALYVNKNAKLLVLPKILSFSLGALLILLGTSKFGLIGLILASIISASIHLVCILFLFEQQKNLLRYKD